MGILGLEPSMLGDTAYAKEMWKWEHFQDETHPRDRSIKGMRPRGYQPYPRLLYLVTGVNPEKFETFEVHDEDEQRNMESRGYSTPLAHAVDVYKAEQQKLAVAAAERNYADRNMSERARAERDAIESESSRHLGEIKERKRPGRRKKILPVPATE